jgi:hypothetical protein
MENLPDQWKEYLPSELSEFNLMQKVFARGEERSKCWALILRTKIISEVWIYFFPCTLREMMAHQSGDKIFIHGHLLIHLRST